MKYTDSHAPKTLNEPPVVGVTSTSGECATWVRGAEVQSICQRHKLFVKLVGHLLLPQAYTLCSLIAWASVS